MSCISDSMSSTGVSQSGKSGGDAFGCAGSFSVADGGTGAGGLGDSISSSASNFASGGAGYGGDAAVSADAIGAVGGDVTDNTSIGSINISA